MVIETLGRLLTEKDNELKKQKETIDSLNKKIKLFEGYLDIYESALSKRGDS